MPVNKRISFAITNYRRQQNDPKLGIGHVLGFRHLRRVSLSSHSLRAPDHTHLRVTEVDRGSGHGIAKEDDVGLQYAGAAAGRAVRQRECPVVCVGKQLRVPIGALLRMLLVATRSAAAATTTTASAIFAVIITNPVFVHVFEPLLHVRSGRERTAVHTSDLYDDSREQKDTTVSVARLKSFIRHRHHRRGEPRIEMCHDLPRFEKEDQMREEERVTVYQILHLYLIGATMEVNDARTARLLVKSVYVLRNEVLQLAGRFQLG